MSDDDLVKLGFVRLDNGTFLPPSMAGMRLVPVGRYIEIQIAIGNGNARIIKVVVPRVAFKLDEGVKL
jgi:hypothetical protein